MRTNIITIITTINLLCVAGYFLVTQHNQIQLLTKRDAIQQQTITEFMWESRTNSDTDSYARGFEAGKLHMGVMFMQGDSAANYADGYHAALEQFGTTPVAEHNYTVHNYTEDQLIDMLIQTTLREDLQKLTNEK